MVSFFSYPNDEIIECVLGVVLLPEWDCNANHCEDVAERHEYQRYYFNSRGCHGKMLITKYILLKVTETLKFVKIELNLRNLKQTTGKQCFCRSKVSIKISCVRTKVFR